MDARIPVVMITRGGDPATKQVIPQDAIPDYPNGLSRWQSESFVGSVVAVGGGLVATGATIARALGYGEVADTVDGVTAIVTDDGFIGAALTVAQALGSVVAMISGLFAARGRLNGGKAASPLR